MIEISRTQELERLRRLALTAQGLLLAQPFGRGMDAVCRAVSQLGYVQIDTISVVERAHHHVLHSRIPGYKPAHLHQLLRAGEVFEYWTHAAAFIPTAHFRFSLPYKQAIKSGKVHWYKKPDRKLMAQLLARIRHDGPLRSRDLEANAVKGSGWWDWKPAKKALEQLYMQGDLMISERQGIQKTYDLAERVLPAEVNAGMPTLEEYAAHILDSQLRCHGLVSLKGLTYLRRDQALRKAVKTRVDEGLDCHELETLRLKDGEVFVLQAGALEGRLPRLGQKLKILSPFDNSVIQRDRLKSLFQYSYQIECYVPASKRRFGYFCLPLLYQGEFIGRMDCKAHRTSRHLEIKALYLEPHPFDPEQIAQAFGQAIPSFCRFQGCDSVSLNRAQPPSIMPSLQRVLDMPAA